MRQGIVHHTKVSSFLLVPEREDRKPASLTSWPRLEKMEHFSSKLRKWHIQLDLSSVAEPLSQGSSLMCGCWSKNLPFHCSGNKMASFLATESQRSVDKGTWYFHHPDASILGGDSRARGDTCLVASGIGASIGTICTTKELRHIKIFETEQMRLFDKNIFQ